MLDFNWSIGRDIIHRKAESKWGSVFFNQLSLDLREMFPDATGFSVTNLKNMKSWYAFYCELNAIRQRPIDELVNGKIRQRVVDQIEMPEVFGQKDYYDFIDQFASQKMDELLYSNDCCDRRCTTLN